MKAWLIECESGRSFVVYADDEYRAIGRFLRMVQGETVRFDNVSLHTPDPVVRYFDERRAPGV